MLFSHPAFWFGSAFVLLLAVNIWVFLRREWESSHAAENYATLHYPLERPTVRKWILEPGHHLTPVIVWDRMPAQWQLLVDGEPHQILPGARPRIAPVGPVFDGSTGGSHHDFKRHYTLRPLPVGFGPDLEFTITVISKEYYHGRGMHFPHDIFFTLTDLPVGKFRRHPLRYWVDDYRYLGATALAEADRILKEEMQVVGTDATMVRMEKIIRHLRTCWVNAGGVPKDDFRWADPLRIYQEMCDGTGKGWCTQNAQVYTFFANRAGVATRFVFGATVQQNRVTYNGHSWAESYLPDQQRWVYVDPQASIIAVYGPHGSPLSSADIFHLCRLDALEGSTARIFKDWGWQDLPFEAAPGEAIEVPFRLVSRVAKKSANEQTIIKYRRPPNVEDVRDVYSMLLRDRVFAWTNLKRYLFQPAPAYSLTPPFGSPTYLVRRMLFAGLIISAAGLVWSFF